jgi:hypothetical protein
MKTLRPFLSAALLCVYTVAFTGCGETTAPTPPPAADQHDHEHEHDHEHADGHDEHEAHGEDSHAGHDHPAHGPNGGHMVELSGGAHAEWTHDDDKDLLTVFVEDPAAVTKVEMKTSVGGKETAYSFEKQEADGQITYQLVSPELLTAIKMGELVEANLIITTADGEITGKVQHHSH